MEVEVLEDRRKCCAVSLTMLCSCSLPMTSSTIPILPSRLPGRVKKWRMRYMEREA
jgi:hypothetical protein